MPSKPATRNATDPRRPVIALAALALVLVVAWALRRYWLPQPRVLVLGLDGATWRVIDSELARGKLPNLGKLLQSGVRGDLISSPPILSPVVWTTIFTGKKPVAHGVTGWQRSTSRHRRTKAIWNIASERGLRATVLNVPGTWPPEAINGAMVSGFPISEGYLGEGTGVVVTAAGLAKSELPHYYRPAAEEIAAQASALAVGNWSSWISTRSNGQETWVGIFKIKRLGQAKYYLSPVYRSDEQVAISAPPSLQSELAQLLGIPYIPEGPGWANWRSSEQPAYLYDHLVEISRLQARAALALLGRPWDLFIYVITLTDRVQHPYWSFMEPERFTAIDPEMIELYRTKVASSYEEADRQIGEILSQVNGRTYVVVLSDHGFRASPSPNKHIGEHDVTGIYLIAGPGITRAEGRPAHLVDVTPTLLYLLGQPLASDMPGGVIPALLHQLRREMVRVPTYEGTPRPVEGEPIDESIKKQLKDLGYIEN